MPVTIVVGGQYGSEGKGKVTALLAAALDRPFLVRCGGPNSGHTVTINGKETVLRQVPSSVAPDGATFCLAAGCAVDEDILNRALDLLKIDRADIVVDPRAVLVTDADKDAEREAATAQAVLMAISNCLKNLSLYAFRNNHRARAISRAEMGHTLTHI